MILLKEELSGEINKSYRYEIREAMAYPSMPWLFVLDKSGNRLRTGRWRRTEE